MFPQDMFTQMNKQINDQIKFFSSNQFQQAPQQGFPQQQPQGFSQQPPQGFQQPPQGFPQPQQDFQQQQQQGYQQGYQQASQGFNQPPNGFGQPPQNYQQQPQYAQQNTNQQQFQQQNQQQPQQYPTESDFKCVNFTHSFGNGHGLKSGQYMKSPFSKYFLVLHDTGNMVLYQDKQFSPQYAYWSTHTSYVGKAPYQCIMQKNGNLELKDASGAVIWQTRTNGIDKPGMHKVELKSDGNLVLKGFRKDNIWCSGVPRRK